MSDKIELIVIHRVKSMGPGLIGIQYGDEDFEKAQSFVSLDAGDATGEATTLPLKFKGRELKGFGLADCDTITADSTAHQVTWRSKTDLSGIAGKTIRLKFQMKNTKLYAFEFKD